MFHLLPRLPASLGITICLLTSSASFGSADPFNEVLLVYNSSDSESIRLLHYYQEHRPGAKYAQTLAVSTPRSESIPQDTYETQLRQPVVDWLKAHPESRTRFIVLMRGIPTRIRRDYPDEVSIKTKIKVDFTKRKIMGLAGLEFLPRRSAILAGLPSVQFQLSRALQDLKAPSDPSPLHEYVIEGETTQAYQNTPDYIGFHTFSLLPSSDQAFAQSIPFDPKLFPGTTALVTHLDMGSELATQAYIQKLKWVYSQMKNPNTILSAQDAGLEGRTYYIEELAPQTPTNTETITFANRPSAYTLLGDPMICGLMRYFPKTDFQRTFGSLTPTMESVRGLVTYGTYLGRKSDYATNGELIFRGNSSWFIMMSVESFNGQQNSQKSKQENYVGWFSKTAFGSQNYENTPVGAVAHVEEPLISGVSDSHFFMYWEKGLLFSEAAWLSRRTQYFLAIGDPLVRK